MRYAFCTRVRLVTILLRLLVDLRLDAFTFAVYVATTRFAVSYVTHPDYVCLFTLRCCNFAFALRDCPTVTLPRFVTYLRLLGCLRYVTLFVTLFVYVYALIVPVYVLPFTFVVCVVAVDFVVRVGVLPFALVVYAVLRLLLLLVTR